MKKKIWSFRKYRFNFDIASDLFKKKKRGFLENCLWKSLRDNVQKTYFLEKRYLPSRPEKSARRDVSFLLAYENTREAIESVRIHIRPFRSH